MSPNYIPRMFSFLRELPQAYIHPVRFHRACQQATGSWFPAYVAAAATGAAITIATALMYTWWTSEDLQESPWHHWLLLSHLSAMFPYLVLAWLANCTYTAYTYLLVAITADKRSGQHQQTQEDPQEGESSSGETPPNR